MGYLIFSKWGDSIDKPEIPPTWIPMGCKLNSSSIGGGTKEFSEFNEMSFFDSSLGAEIDLRSVAA